MFEGIPDKSYRYRWWFTAFISISDWYSTDLVVLINMKFEALRSSNDAEVRKDISIHKGTFLENGEINLLHFFIFLSIYVFKDLCYFEAKIKSSQAYFT